MKREKKIRVTTIINNLSIIMCVFTFFSCDPQTYIHKVVINKSDYDLKLLSSYDSSEFIISKKSVDTVGTYLNYARRVYETYDNCTGYLEFDSISVLNDSTLTVTKYINQNNNWFYQVQNKRVGQCTMIIANEDIN